MAERIVDHLNELRRRLIIALTAVAALTGLSYCFADELLRFFLKPAVQHLGQLYFFSPADGFMLTLHVSFFCGVALSVPVIIAQVWAFIGPALYRKEQKFAKAAVVGGSVLFALGAAFAYTVAVPMALAFLSGFQTQEIQAMISVKEYLGFILSLCLAFGISFNLPLFVLGLAYYGLVNTRQLSRLRPYAVIAIFIAAAVLTPPDVMSQFMLAIPLWILYEVSVGVSRIFSRPGRTHP